MKLEPYDNYFWQGDKVRLRATQVEDAEKKLREYTDTQSRSWLEAGMDLPPTSLEAYIERSKPYCNFNDTSRMTLFSIETLEGEYVGWINLYHKDMRNGVFAPGLSIFREYWRNGYGEEAFRIILRYGFHQLRMQKCNSACIAINEGSIRLHRKVGFQEEGRRRRVIYLDGQFHDDILWGMLKEEFDENEKS